MYSLSETEVEGVKYLIINNPNKTSNLRLCLNQGGRIDELIFNNINVIPKVNYSSYQENYASAILFPFTNRIRKGQYVFNGIDYCLKCNEIGRENALHGLIYDKVFEYVGSVFSPLNGSVTLRYSNQKKIEGFPFEFEVVLVYTLDASGVILSFTVINSGKKGFPFAVGWHPYFISSSLEESALFFDSETKFLCDEQKILNDKISFYEPMPYQVREGGDEAYLLNTGEVSFVTPDYQMKIECSSKVNFLQLYRPNEPNQIAVEPMTGPCNSFNNGLGLQVLLPGETYNLKWNVSIDTIYEGHF